MYNLFKFFFLLALSSYLEEFSPVGWRNNHARSGEIKRVLAPVTEAFIKGLTVLRVSGLPTAVRTHMDTHNHTQALTQSLTLSLSHTCSHTLILHAYIPSQPHTNTHTHSHTHTHTHTHACTAGKVFNSV